MTIIFSKDSLRASVEAATGGKVTVLYDDKGYPSYMNVVPKFNVEDIDSDLGTGVHPAFLVDGVEKSEIFIGQYQAVVKDGRAVSLPGVDPTASLNYDAAAGYCTAKGAGWHLMTNWEWAAVALWCLANSFQPRGNTYYGRHHDQVHEQGLRQDGIAPGTASGTARTLTGSGPASWRHDGTFAGIADLVGNVWEWVGGMKLSSGKIYMPNDNDFNADEADWVDQGVIIANDSGAKLGVDGTDTLYSTGGTSFGAWKGLTTTTAYDALSAAVKARMLQACVDPYDATNPVGYLYFDTDGERLPFRGGYWNNGADAGAFALNLSLLRSHVYTNFGFRPAFVA